MSRQTRTPNCGLVSNWRTTGYRFTLPVVAGVIQDPDGRLQALIDAVRVDNARRPTAARRRAVIDKKYRGPRHGRDYGTPVWAATAVDIYVRDRREW